jgi:hypothetical protein
MDNLTLSVCITGFGEREEEIKIEQMKKGAHTYNEDENVGWCRWV